MTGETTSVEVDEELLNSAQRVLATGTARATVEKALLAVLLFRARREEVLALTSQTGLDLGDDELMRRSWAK